MSSIKGCPPDEEAIKRYVSIKNTFNWMPFIGPNIGNAVYKPPANQAEDELKASSATLTTNIDKLAGMLVGKVVEEENLINSTIDILKNYVDATQLLLGEELSEGITSNTVRIVALLIVVLIIIFLGL